MKRLFSTAVCSTAMCVAVCAFADSYTSEGYLQDGLVAQWDAVGNAAAQYRLSNFTGAGIIKVGKLGTSIILR